MADLSPQMPRAGAEYPEAFGQVMGTGAPT